MRRQKGLASELASAWHVSPALWRHSLHQAIKPHGLIGCLHRSQISREQNENNRLPKEPTRPDLLYVGFPVALEFVMAPRAYWKGYLKLSLVSCPIALFPATSEREKISFHQLNKNTGHRIKYRKVDAESGDELDPPTSSRGTRSARASTSSLIPKSWKPSLSKANEP